MEQDDNTSFLRKRSKKGGGGGGGGGGVAQLLAKPSSLHCGPCLVPRRLFLDENVRAKEGGKESRLTG